MDTVLRTQQPGWQARLEGAERGEFPTADSRSRPGTEYTIGLWHAGSHQKIQVLAFLAEDLNPAARADDQFQGRAVLRYVFSRLENGWAPELGELPPLTIGNPDPSYRYAPTAARPTFMERLTRKTEAAPPQPVATDENNPEWIEEI